MDLHANYAPLMPTRRARHSRPPVPAVRWFREWVPQEIAATGRKCLLLKWVTEDMMKVLKESKELETKEAEPEQTTEVLFLCSHEGCGKTFIDVGALRKHAHIHGERQHICPYEGCGRKFLDSSKLKRHFLIHTGAKDYVCPYEGCGKAFSLDFNLRTHMKTHLPENYHVCPHKDCGKRYTQEHKLNAHLKTFHEKNTAPEFTKHAPVEKPHYNPKPASIVYTPARPDRPYACPYEGCGKAYIHEYKLNLHLKREHPGHNSEENRKQVPAIMARSIDDASDPDAHVVKGGSSKKSKKRKPSPLHEMPEMPISKISNRKSLTLDSRTLDIAEKPWTETKVEEDSEETEEDRDNVEDTIWWYRENEDDEETEDED